MFETLKRLFTEEEEHEGVMEKKEPQKPLPTSEEFINKLKNSAPIPTRPKEEQTETEKFYILRAQLAGLINVFGSYSSNDRHKQHEVFYSYIPAGCSSEWIKRYENCELWWLSLFLTHFLEIADLMHEHGYWKADELWHIVEKEYLISSICLDVNISGTAFVKMNRKIFKLPIMAKDNELLRKIDDILWTLHVTCHAHSGLEDTPYLKLDEIEQIRQMPQWKDILEKNLNEEDKEGDEDGKTM